MVNRKKRRKNQHHPLTPTNNKPTWHPENCQERCQQRRARCDEQPPPTKLRHEKYRKNRLQNDARWESNDLRVSFQVSMKKRIKQARVAPLQKNSDKIKTFALCLSGRYSANNDIATCPLAIPVYIYNVWFEK